MSVFNIENLQNKSFTNILTLLKHKENDNFQDFLSNSITIKTTLIAYMEQLKAFDKKSLIQQYKNKIKKNRAYKALQQLLNQINKN